MAELSIIVPFCNEYPQIVFTLRAVAEQFLGRVDFEILAVNNYHHSLDAEGFEEDKSASACKNGAVGLPWLRVLDGPDVLSHWQAKNLAVGQATGEFLLFLDAHVVPSRDALWTQFEYFRAHHRGLDGSMHLPLAYQILEWRKLIYRHVVDLDLGQLSYTFDDFRESEAPYRIATMSTCGMLVHREVFDLLGGWPKELGSYSGGEHFWNYSMAALGKKVWIWPHGTLYHHGERRGFPVYGLDMVRNQCIGIYVAAGRTMAERFMANVRIPAFPKPIAPTQEMRRSILEDVLESCFDHRQLIESRQKISLVDWLAQWNAKGERGYATPI